MKLPVTATEAALMAADAAKGCKDNPSEKAAQLAREQYPDSLLWPHPAKWNFRDLVMARGAFLEKNKWKIFDYHHDGRIDGSEYHIMLWAKLLSGGTPGRCVVTREEYISQIAGKPGEPGSTWEMLKSSNDQTVGAAKANIESNSMLYNMVDRNGKGFVTEKDTAEDDKSTFMWGIDKLHRGYITPDQDWRPPPENLISPAHLVAIKDLVGLSPAAAQQKLVALNVRWPTLMGLEMDIPGGRMSFTTLLDLLEDQGAVEVGARGRNQDYNSNDWPHEFTQCTAQYDGSDSDSDAVSLALEFVNGRMTRAWDTRDVADRDFSKEPPWPGNMETHLQWRAKPVPSDTKIKIKCKRNQDPATETRNDDKAGPGMAGGNVLQSLIGGSLAPMLPEKNERRAAARREGGAAWKALEPGATLRGGVGEFLAGHRFVKALKGSNASFSVLKVDLGAYPSNNVSNYDDYGYVGVRGDRVQWRAFAPLDAMFHGRIDPSYDLDDKPKSPFIREPFPTH